MPYFNPYNNQYMPTGYNPYLQNTQRQQDPYYNLQPNLQGKIVDNIEVVKAIDIPLNGITNYFPLADGSAIVTKQLQQDGKSRTIVYKPTIEEKPEEIKYVTESELKDIREEIEGIKKQIEHKEESHE